MARVPGRVGRRSAKDSVLEGPTAGGLLARAAYARVLKARIDVRPLLAKAALTAEQMKDHKLRLKVQSQIAFLNLAASALEDDFLGFHIAKEIELREIGAIYYILSSSDTLGEGLQRMSRYTTCVNEGVRVAYGATKHAAVTLEYVEVARHSDRHQIEFFVTLVVRLCRHLTGQRIQPTWLRLAHRRSTAIPEFRSFFDCDVEFGSRGDELAFDRSIDQLPLPGRDPFLNKILIDLYEKAQSGRSAQPIALQIAVENAIAPLLPHGEARVAEVARKLGMSQRTLARRLAADGATFAEVLDQLRFDLAKSYLQEPHFTISTIAWLLGYQEVSAFTHAFRRWSGKSPRQVRSGGPMPDRAVQ
jgi:AraC-like DNA-binding protein